MHDFYPVELVWNDGSSACERYWFYPQHRIDSVDLDETTYERLPGGRGRWRPNSNGTSKLVFSRTAISDRHVWIDKFLGGGSFVFISEAFRSALEEAGVTGVGFKHYGETD